MSTVTDLLLDVTPSVRWHTVEYPENLATIACHYYGYADHAMAIYQANRSIIADPNTVYAGQRLVIPHLPHTKPGR